MPDVPGFVSAAGGAAVAFALFVITTQRGDIRDLAGRAATEADWRRQHTKARLVLAAATLLLAALVVITVRATADLLDGKQASASEWVAIAALLAGAALWPFALRNARLAGTHLATVRRRVYGRA